MVTFSLPPTEVGLMGAPSTGLKYIQEDFPSDWAVWWPGGLVGCRDMACFVLGSCIPCLHLLLPYKERQKGLLDNKQKSGYYLLSVPKDVS